MSNNIFTFLRQIYVFRITKKNNSRNFSKKKKKKIAQIDICQKQKQYFSVITFKINFNSLNCQILKKILPIDTANRNNLTVAHA